MSHGRTADLRRLQLACFLSTVDRFALPPVLLAIAHGLGTDLADVVSAAGVYFLVYGLAQPFWGALSVRLGMARTIYSCIAAGGAASLATALAGSVVWLAIIRAVAGGFFSAAFPTALIYVGATAVPRHRQREVTDLMTGVAIGTALSTAGAGLLAYLVGWQWVFVASGGACLVSVPFLKDLHELPRTPWRDPLLAPVRHILTNRATVQLFGLALLEGLAVFGALTFVPTALESVGHNTAVAAGVTAVYGLAVLVAARTVGKLSLRVPASRFIGVGAACATTGCILLAIDVNASTALAACVLFGLAWASMHSSLQTWATEISPGNRALTVSFFATSLFAGSAAAAEWGGPLAQHHEFRSLFGYGAAVLVAVGLVGFSARARWELRQAGGLH